MNVSRVRVLWLAVVLLLGTSACTSSLHSIRKVVSPWRSSADFNNSSAFKLVDIKRGIRLSPLPVQVEVQEHSIWVRSLISKAGKQEFHRNSLIPLEKGRLPKRNKPSKKAISAFFPKLRDAMRQARSSVWKMKGYKKASPPILSVGDVSVDATRTFALFLHKEIPYQTMAKVFGSAAQAGFVNVLLGACLKTAKSQNCSLRYLPVLSPKKHFALLNIGIELGETGSLRFINSALLKPNDSSISLRGRIRTSPLVLPVLLQKTSLTLDAQKSWVFKSCHFSSITPEQKRKKKRINFLKGNRIDKLGLGSCLRRLHKTARKDIYLILVSGPQMKWKQIAEVMEAIRFRKGGKVVFRRITLAIRYP